MLEYHKIAGPLVADIFAIFGGNQQNIQSRNPRVLYLAERPNIARLFLLLFVIIFSLLVLRRRPPHIGAQPKEPNTSVEFVSFGGYSSA